ncbi:hypothetical protein K32_05830 [Kaistia sp. 32K]|nr:hypothetical protein K32_05830 [Kaistia sp. 32K]
MWGWQFPNRAKAGCVPIRSARQACKAPMPIILRSPEGASRRTHGLRALAVPTRPPTVVPPSPSSLRKQGSIHPRHREVYAASNPG